MGAVSMKRTIAISTPPATVRRAVRTMRMRAPYAGLVGRQITTGVVSASINSPCEYRSSPLLARSVACPSGAIERHANDRHIVACTQPMSRVSTVQALDDSGHDSPLVSFPPTVEPYLDELIRI